MDALLYRLFIALSLGVIGVGFLAAISILLPYFWDGPYVPSELEDVRTMLELANIQPGELVVDLGAGDGRILFLAAREYGARTLGVEISPLRSGQIWLKARLFGLQRQVQIRLGNLYRADLSTADVVTLYLLPAATNRLQAKLEQELRPGSRVVSNSYPVGDWPHSKRSGFVYLYERCATSLTEPAQNVGRRTLEPDRNTSLVGQDEREQDQRRTKRQQNHLEAVIRVVHGHLPRVQLGGGLAFVQRVAQTNPKRGAQRAKT